MNEDIADRVYDALKEMGYSEDQIIQTRILRPDINAKKFMVSIPMFAKDFIKKVLIDELAEVVKISPWNSFIAISSGIEFLGKCIDTKSPDNWDAKGKSSDNFKDAITYLNGLNNYKYLLSRPGFNLYNEFRCGLIHGFAPKGTISLSHGKNEDKDLSERNGMVNFNAEELYANFKIACEDVINRSFSNPNKMNDAKIWINATVLIP
jgi:hypothetical protein